MKVYDYDRIAFIIERAREIMGDNFRAILGIKEDFDKTSKLIYEDGTYHCNLYSQEPIRGRYGSNEHTPVLFIVSPCGNKIFSVYKDM